MSSTKVIDKGTNNKTVEGQVDYDTTPITGKAYRNILENRVPIFNYHVAYVTQSKVFIDDISTFATYTNCEQKAESETETLKVIKIPAEMFDGTKNSYATIVDTTNYIFGSVWYLPQGYWVRANRKYLEIEYYTEEDSEIYYGIGVAPNNIDRASGKLKGAKNNQRASIFIPLENFAQFGLYFYAKDSKQGQTLRIYNIKLYVDSLSIDREPDVNNPRNYYFENKFGTEDERPTAPYPGMLYFNTDNNSLQLNIGNSSAPNWIDIFTQTLTF